jgi:hypothetical protein
VEGNNLTSRPAAVIRSAAPGETLSYSLPKVSSYLPLTLALPQGERKRGKNFWQSLYYDINSRLESEEDPLGERIL